MSMFARIGSVVRGPRRGRGRALRARRGGREAQRRADRRRARRPGGSVAVFAPRSFGDVTEIADALRARQVVIVNVQGADRNLLQRVVDFTSGVAYTIDGRIQKLAEAIYLVVPSGVNVNSAGVREQLDNDGILGIRDLR